MFMIVFFKLYLKFCEVQQEADF